jgi:hypothetical protein
MFLVCLSLYVNAEVVSNFQIGIPCFHGFEPLS